MSKRKYWDRTDLSEGERGVLLAFFGVAMFGAAISFMIVNQLGGLDNILRPLSWYDLWMIVAGIVGAGTGLFAAKSFFGLPGMRGLGHAIVGVVGVSFIGAIVGGTIALPFYGTMFGPFLLAVTFWMHPVLCTFWALTLIGAHALFFMWRRERDSIFSGPQDDGIPA